MSAEEMLKKEQERLDRHISGRGAPRPAPVRRQTSETHSAMLVTTAPAKKPAVAPAPVAQPAKPKPVVATTPTKPAPAPAAPAAPVPAKPASVPVAPAVTRDVPPPPVTKVEPTSTKPVVSATTSSLDSLVESLLGMSPRSAAPPPPPPPAAPAPAPVPAAPAPVAPVQQPRQDLDSILADLEGMAKQQEKPAEQQKPPEPRPVAEPKPVAEPAVNVSVTVTSSVPEPEPTVEATTMCAACGKAINGKHYQCQERLFHVECLVCHECHKPIERYNVKDDKFLCTECFRKLSPPKTCGKCGKEISGASVVAMGASFHSDCFTCAFCSKVIIESYIEHEGKCYCPEEIAPCYKRALGKICTICGKPLEANYLAVLGKQYHKTCFQCHGCHKVFETLEFFPIHDEPYCEACATKLQQQEEEHQQQH